MSANIDRVIEIFEDLNRIPRCSKNEQMISKWLVDWAKDHGFEAKQDEVFNVVIKVPATEGFENAPILVLQGHMDMVCVKSENSEHDFTKDAVKIVRDGEWIKADNTTLGADNGIAIAIALAFAESKEIAHPATELLFTVDEETGLTGASRLSGDFLEGKVLINIDSEDEGVFTIGCAGGANVKINKTVELQDIKDEKFIKINVGGMLGGHSGIEINQPRVNAIKILAEIFALIADQKQINLVSISGGIAHNAIPSNAEATIAVKATDASEIITDILQKGNLLKLKFADIEKNLYVKTDEIDVNAEITKTYNDVTTKNMIKLLNDLPHGVMKMSEVVEGAVETSCNLAQIDASGEDVVITMSLRSNVDTEIDGLRNKIQFISAENGAEIKTSGQYPSWQPNANSPLLLKCQQVYENTFATKPVIEVIHAGLECGIIGAKYEGMDMISIGPTIQHPHTPTERLNIPSLESIFKFMTELFLSYKI